MLIIDLLCVTIFINNNNKGLYLPNEKVVQHGSRGYHVWKSSKKLKMMTIADLIGHKTSAES